MIRPLPEDFQAAYDTMPGYRWLALRNAINARDREQVGALVLQMMDDYHSAFVQRPNNLAGMFSSNTHIDSALLDELRKLGL